MDVSAFREVRVWRKQHRIQYDTERMYLFRAESKTCAHLLANKRPTNLNNYNAVSSFTTNMHKMASRLIVFDRPDFRVGL
jgi:hypothetical protein